MGTHLINIFAHIDMQKTVEQKFLDFSFPNAEKPILVGLSGGADSIVLAHLLHKFGFKIGIGHCHFNLRGADADADQLFSKEFAKTLNVPFFTVKFETKIYAETRGISIQMAARNLRYFWFEKICKENGYQHVAVGTHLTDNIETFIFNASRGTGLTGLKGIKPINDRIIRPLINITKEDIYNYAQLENLTWKEDLSNQSIKYYRNKIRHQILPVLKDINPNFEQTFQRNFKRLSRSESFISKQIEQIWKNWVIKDQKGISLKIQDLISEEFADVVLLSKLEPLGFKPSQITDLLNTIESQPGAVISSKDYHIYIDREKIFIHKKRFFSIPNEYLITEFLGETTQPLRLKFKDFHANEISFSNKKSIAYFDFDTLKFPLKLRKWKDGDRLHPFGMKGQKKVSDILINAKIPLHEKENIWVIESDNEICWVIGLRSSEKYKVSKNTSRVYVVELIEENL